MGPCLNPNQNSTLLPYDHENVLGCPMSFEIAILVSNKINGDRNHP